jgi:bifunctional DNA-binding transcriptional regulator/antitoxin component of YhaV-PrlF toxin-antitoxin module
MERICPRDIRAMAVGFPRTPEDPISLDDPAFLLLLGELTLRTKYTDTMEAIHQYLVSASGQMSVPAAVRHRWHLDNGGPVDVIDLGFGVLTVPAGQAQRLLGDLLSREDHAAFVQSLIDDPDLATS